MMAIRDDPIRGGTAAARPGPARRCLRRLGVPWSAAGRLSQRAPDGVRRCRRGGPTPTRRRSAGTRDAPRPARCGVGRVVESDDGGGYRVRVASAAEMSRCSGDSRRRRLPLNRLAHHSGALPISAAISTRGCAGPANSTRTPCGVRGAGRGGARAVVALRGKDRDPRHAADGRAARPAAYSAGERRTLRHSADQLALMLENARLTGRILEQERLRRDLALAAESSVACCPTRRPQAARDLAAVTIAARNVGRRLLRFPAARRRPAGPRPRRRLRQRRAGGADHVGGPGLAADHLRRSGLPLPDLAARMNSSSTARRSPTATRRSSTPGSTSDRWSSTMSTPGTTRRSGPCGRCWGDDPGAGLRRHRPGPVPGGQPRERLDHARAGDVLLSSPTACRKR